MMREMEQLTAVNGTRCISFREKNASDAYFITIINGSGCYAPVSTCEIVRRMHLDTSARLDHGEPTMALGLFH